MKKSTVGTMLLCMALCLCMLGCDASNTEGNGSSPAASQTKASNQEAHEEAPQASEGEQAMSTTTHTTQNAEDTTLRMSIGSTSVNVEWEGNESVEALKELCQDGPLTIAMSMYGGFEQVGSLGQSLPANNTQMTTQAGDFVLYSGNQIVVFYGSNSWSYTKLGHIADKSDEELAQLLGNGDVTITLEQGQ